MRRKIEKLKWGETQPTLREPGPRQFTAKKHARPRYNYIIHNDHRFVYLWIHKVACSSVKAALLPLFDLDPTPYERVLPDGRRHFIVHDVFRNTEYQVSGGEFLDSGRYEEYFKFAFTRNPFDRLVSCYRNKIDRPRIPQYMLASAEQSEVAFYPHMSFAEFVEVVCYIPNRLADGHFRPQHLTICDREGNIAADYVGSFENIEEDFAYVKQRIGKPDLELPERNRKRPTKSDPFNYRNFYDSKLKELVYERYEKDFETFGYDF